MSIANNSRRGYRTLRLLISQSIYEHFIDDVSFARAIIDQCYADSPEPFPTQFNKGCIFNGLTAPSVKQGCQCRRIELRANKVTFMITLVFLMPYMTALTKEVEKTLFLCRFNVPFWGLTYVSGRNDMFWYRLEQSLGCLNIVGTTIKDSELLPKDLLDDEKHTRLKGNKHYIAMTGSTSEEALRKAYGVFAEEARSVNPDYAPETVNTDGWQATQNAWQYWFPPITVILCFLHAFIKIRDRATKALSDSFQ